MRKLTTVALILCSSSVFARPTLKEDFKFTCLLKAGKVLEIIAKDSDSPMKETHWISAPFLDDEDMTYAVVDLKETGLTLTFGDKGSILKSIMGTAKEKKLNLEYQLEGKPKITLECDYQVPQLDDK